MKNIIKIVATLGIVISFFPIYSMQMEGCYSLERDALKNTNSLSNMNELPIKSFVNNNAEFLSKNHSLFADKGFALRLLIFKVLGELDSEKNNKNNLGKIRDALSLRIPIASKHKIECRGIDLNLRFIISPNSTSVSIFEDIKYLINIKTVPKISKPWKELDLAEAKLGRLAIANMSDDDKKAWPLLVEERENSTRRLKKARDVAVYEEMHDGIAGKLMTAIFQGEKDGKEQLSCELITIVGEDDRLQVEVPKNIMDLIVSYFYIQKDNDKERSALIKQAEQEWRKKDD